MTHTPTKLTVENFLLFYQGENVTQELAIFIRNHWEQYKSWSKAIALAEVKA